MANSKEGDNTEQESRPHSSGLSLPIPDLIENIFRRKPAKPKEEKERPPHGRKIYPSLEDSITPGPKTGWPLRNPKQPSSGK